MQTKITPRIPQGFIELLPEDQLVFNRMKDTIAKAYESFGFLPLDTPVMEYSEVLLAKAGGETEKQIYRFTHHSSDFALRFDLTVPLARYVAQHFPELSFPFKRYQISKSYRGERPQKGRFREFYQCDIDVIGSDSLDITYDAEVVSAVGTVFKALQLGDFVIKINNRKVLGGFFSSLGLESSASDVLRIIDKLPKVGAEKVTEELTSIGVDAASCAKIISFIGTSGTNAEKLAKLKTLTDNETFQTGVSELETVIERAYMFGLSGSNLEIDLSIARGLDYYTGTVYETFIVGHENFGSVCSGGRYDDLAGFYTDKKLPGVGASIGLSRLFAQLKENGLIKADVKTTAKALIVPTDSARFGCAAKTAERFRASGIPTDVIWSDKSLKSKFKYADKLGTDFVIVIGENEENKGTVSLRCMKDGTQCEISADEAVNTILKSIN